MRARCVGGEGLGACTVYEVTSNLSCIHFSAKLDQKGAWNVRDTTTRDFSWRFSMSMWGGRGKGNHVHVCQLTFLFRCKLMGGIQDLRVVVVIVKTFDHASSGGSTFIPIRAISDG